MMSDVVFSCPTIGIQTLSIQNLIAEFNQQHDTAYQFQPFTWAEAWNVLVKTALYGRGADVSGSGSTWISDLVGMNSLRSFTRDELDSLGGESCFLPSAWASGWMGGKMWAIPWMADTRLWYFRRDILKQAHIEINEPILTYEALINILSQLKSYGYPVPFVFPTRETRMMTQYLASMVWEAGGDLISTNGRMLLNQPATRQGILRYFNLAQFITEPAQLLSDDQSDQIFNSGEAAITLTGPWLAQRMPDVDWVRERKWGIALPVVPFIGGSSLVIWRHSHHSKEAMDLIRYLTSPVAQARFMDIHGMLPTRVDVLAALAVDETFYRSIFAGFQNGRSFPTLHLWGLIEERLNTAVGQAWSELFKEPQQNWLAGFLDWLDSLNNQINTEINSR
jgi:multiple sugar transport system substrate-binding protein